MDPLVSVTILDGSRPLSPGSVLKVEYQLAAVAAEDVTSAEASVLWRTAGKGEEDFGVHFFERRLRADAPGGDLRVPHRFETSLPASPLSYNGVIVKIIWCVRVRCFLASGRQICQESIFQLGNVPRGRRCATAQPARKVQRRKREISEL